MPELTDRQRVEHAIRGAINEMLADPGDVPYTVRALVDVALELLALEAERTYSGPIGQAQRIANLRDQKGKEA